MSFKKVIKQLEVIDKQEYVANRKKIANFSLLTFNSYKEDLKIRQDNLRFESYKIVQPIIYFGLIFLLIMITGVTKIDYKFIHDNTITSICLLLLVLSLLFVVLHNFIKFLTITLIIRFPKMGIIGVQLITYLVFYKLLNDIIPQNCKPFLIFKIIILSVLVISQSIIFVKHLPNYLDFEISDTVSLLLMRAAAAHPRSARQSRSGCASRSPRCACAHQRRESPGRRGHGTRTSTSGRPRGLPRPRPWAGQGRPRRRRTPRVPRLSAAVREGGSAPREGRSARRFP